jgi:hypothetical protein
MLSLGEVGKLLGAKWKELNDEEKKVCMLCLLGPRPPICGSLTLFAFSHISNKPLNITRAEEKSAYEVSATTSSTITLTVYVKGKKGAGSGDGEDNDEDDE